MPAGCRSHRQVCSLLFNPTNSVVTPNLAISRRFHTELPHVRRGFGTSVLILTSVKPCVLHFLLDPSQTKHRDISGLFLPRDRRVQRRDANASGTCPEKWRRCSRIGGRIKV